MQSLTNKRNFYCAVCFFEHNLLDKSCEKEFKLAALNLHQQRIALHKRCNGK